MEVFLYMCKFPNSRVAAILQQRFSHIVDFRQPWKIKHAFVVIIFAIIIGLFCGKRTCFGFFRVMQCKEKWVKDIFGVETLPSKYTIRRSILLVNYEGILESLMEFVASFGRPAPGSLLCGDGKTFRSGHEKCQRKNGLHIVTIWCPSLCLPLAIGRTEEKSSELAQLQTIIPQLDLFGYVLSLDAAGGVPLIAHLIISAGGDYLLAIKNNQPLTYCEIEECFTKSIHPLGASLQEIDEAKKNYDENFYEYHVKANGRFTTRRVWSKSVDELPSIEFMKNKWESIKTIICIETEVTKNKNVKSEEPNRRYFISSVEKSTEQFANLIREHWDIEVMHNILDVTFKEDNSPTADRNGLYNIGLLRRYVLSICKMLSKKLKINIPEILDKFAMGDNIALRNAIVCGSVELINRL